MANSWRAKLTLLDPKSDPQLKPQIPIAVNPLRTLFTEGESIPDEQRASDPTDDTADVEKKEKREVKRRDEKGRFVFSIALAYRGYNWVVPAVDIKELRAINKAIAPFVPSYLHVAFPAKKVVVRKKFREKFAAKRLQQLEKWLNDLLEIVDIDVIEGIKEVLQVPTDVLPWLRRVGKARNREQTFASNSSGDMLFSDLGDKPPATGECTILDLPPAPLSVPASTRPLVVEYWLSRDIGPATAGIYRPAFTIPRPKSVVNRPRAASTNPFLAAVPTESSSISSSSSTRLRSSTNPFLKMDPEPVVKPPTLNSTATVSVASSDTLTVSLGFEKVLDVCYDFDNTLVDLSWQARAQESLKAGKSRQKDFKDLAYAEYPAAKVNEQEALDYWRITNAAINAKSRFKNEYRMCPLFVEMPRKKNQSLGEGLQMLMATVQLRMSGIELMQLTQRLLNISGVSIGTWGMFERRITQQGIFERPLADFDVVGKLMSRGKLPELRCRPNPTRQIYYQFVKTSSQRPVHQGSLSHYTLDAGWQRVWARCGTDSKGMPSFTVYRDADYKKKIGTMNLRECRPYFWTGVAQKLMKPHGFAIFVEKMGAPKPIPFYFAAKGTQEKEVWVTAIFACQTKNYYYHSNLPKAPISAAKRRSSGTSRQRSQSMISHQSKQRIPSASVLDTTAEDDTYIPRASQTTAPARSRSVGKKIESTKSNKSFGNSNPPVPPLRQSFLKEEDIDDHLSETNLHHTPNSSAPKNLHNPFATWLDNESANGNTIETTMVDNNHNQFNPFAEVLDTDKEASLPPRRQTTFS